MAITKVRIAALLIIFLTALAAGAYYGIISPGASTSDVRGSPTTSETSSNSQEKAMMLALAQEHWTSIDQKNLSAIMSEYSTKYEAVWFYINSTSQMGPTNGRYDCNIPTGPGNCSQFLEFAWLTFFNLTSWSGYEVCNTTFVKGLAGRDFVKATLWYWLSNRNETLVVPYEMDFEFFNNTWGVYRDWFGQAQNNALVLNGISFPAACTNSS